MAAEAEQKAVAGIDAPAALYEEYLCLRCREGRVGRLRGDRLDRCPVCGFKEGCC